MKHYGLRNKTEDKNREAVSMLTCFQDLRHSWWVRKNTSREAEKAKKLWSLLGRRREEI
jgi:hypothetical protein